MSLRETIAKAFARLKPNAREDMNKAARTPDQIIADREIALQLKELQAEQAARVDSDRATATEKAGLYSPGPVPVPDGATASPPLTDRDINTKGDRGFFTKRLHERQRVASKSTEDAVKDSKARVPRDALGEKAKPSGRAAPEPGPAAKSADQQHPLEPDKATADYIAHVETMTYLLNSKHDWQAARDAHRQDMEERSGQETTPDTPEATQPPAQEQDSGYYRAVTAEETEQLAAMAREAGREHGHDEGHESGI